MDNVAVRVEGVSKAFKLPHEKQSSVKGLFVSMFYGKRTFERQQVLRDISFKVKKGDFFGIVGRNGSGKSTLLKLLAGIYSPDSGHIQVNGSLTPFIELGVGFNQELTGRENVFLNGALLGFNRSEMDAMYDDIVAFAELEKFMDQKLKNYSSGMQVRLAFSIAIRAEGDILLLDEVLAVGDEAFQRKCYDYFDDLKRNKKTVIIVTHDMAAVEEFCNRAILIEAGRIVKGGKASVVARAYHELLNPTGLDTEGVEGVEELELTKQKQRWGDEKLKIDEVTLKQAGTLGGGSEVEIHMTVKCNKRAAGDIVVGYTLKSEDQTALLGNVLKVSELGKLKPGSVVECVLSVPNIFSDGNYSLDLSIREASNEEYCDFWLDCATMKISHNKSRMTSLKSTVAKRR